MGPKTKPNEQEIIQTADELTEIEIAELANKEIQKKDEEITKLKKELAVSKLYSKAEEEEEVLLTREECIKRISDNHTTNYDYAEAVVNLVEIEEAEGRVNPLGKNGKQVYEFFKDVLEECGDDKSRFVSVYQTKLGPDDTQVAMAYKNRNK